MYIWRDVGVMVPELWLPSPEVDPVKFAVIACDQHTAEPEYWNRVEKLVGDAPSTLRLTYPEVYLSEPDRGQRIAGVEAAMADYLRQGLLRRQKPGMMLVKREVDEGFRWGLVMAVDLERYDHRPGAKALIRATEGTILSRIPPRAEIRRRVEMEFPHIMLLIDDPGQTVIEPLIRRERPVSYDFELMLGGGRVTGYHVAEGLEAVHDALQALGEAFRRQVDEQGDPMIFAAGDGNHSLATAKACWEEVKATLPPGAEHPARYALVEVVNLHDPCLNFEPIHRVVFGRPEVVPQVLTALRDRGAEVSACSDWRAGLAEAETCNGMLAASETQMWLIRPGGAGWELPVAALQQILDEMELGEALDYVHGDETARRLGEGQGNGCFLLPPLDKSRLFEAVARQGVLPRKTFSMGHAHQKRYYMEGRMLRPFDNGENLR